MRPELWLRRAELDDFEAVLAVINDPDSVHRRVASRHGERPEDPLELFERLAQDENLVAELDGVVVGYASWQYFGAHAHLNVMAVAGAMQRRGVGRQLFAAWLAACAEVSVHSFSLRAFADSPWALTFYEAQGMRRYQEGDEAPPEALGLWTYVTAARLSGQWPDPTKILFWMLN